MEGVERAAAEPFSEAPGDVVVATGGRRAAKALVIARLARGGVETRVVARGDRETE